MEMLVQTNSVCSVTCESVEFAVEKCKVNSFQSSRRLRNKKEERMISCCTFQFSKLETKLAAGRGNSRTQPPNRMCFNSEGIDAEARQTCCGVIEQYWVEEAVKPATTNLSYVELFCSPIWQVTEVHV